MIAHARLLEFDRTPVVRLSVIVICIRARQSSGQETVRTNNWHWIPLAYLHNLVDIGSDPEQASFFRRYWDLIDGSPLGARDALRAYASRLRDSILPVAEDLASNPATQAQLGANDRDELLACIAATIYLRPGDPICGNLYKDKDLAEHRGQIAYARRRVLKRLRALLQAREDLAVIAASRLGDVEGHGAERVGVKAFSHHARESLLFALCALLLDRNDRSNPTHSVRAFCAALDSLINRLDNPDQGGLKELTAPPLQVPENHSALFQALRIPILTDLKFAEQTLHMWNLGNHATAANPGIADGIHVDPEDLRPAELAHQVRALEAEHKTLAHQLGEPSAESGEEADAIMRRIERIQTQIAAHRAELARRRHSKLLPAARERVRLYYPVLLKILELMDACDQALTMAGQAVPARDLGRLCFAAQRISFLVERRYTYATRAQMVRDLSRVFQATQDPATGDALAAFERFAATRAKELFGPAYDRFLGQIVARTVASQEDKRDHEGFSDAVHRVRKSLDDCLEADLEGLAPSAPATLDLTDPTLVVNLYQKTLYLIYLLQRGASPGYVRARAALEILVKNLQDLTSADFGVVMKVLLDELESMWHRPLPPGPWTRSRIAALQRAIESVWSERFAEHDEAAIMGAVQMRRQFFLSQIVIGLLDTRSRILAEGEVPDGELDAARAKRFFTQTFKPNLEAGKHNWPRDEWEHLTHRLVGALPPHRALDHRIAAQFGTLGLSDPRKLFRQLLELRVDGLTFADFFSREVMHRLDQPSGQMGATQ